MRSAIAQARLAMQQGEVPVGAIIVDDATHTVLAEACNSVESSGVWSECILLLLCCCR